MIRGLEQPGRRSGRETQGTEAAFAEAAGPWRAPPGALGGLPLWPHASPRSAPTCELPVGPREPEVRQAASKLLLLLLFTLITEASGGHEPP